jgi:hypothetical protein
MCVWCVCVCACVKKCPTVGWPSLSGEDHGCRRLPLRVTLTATTRRQSAAPPTPPLLCRGCFNVCCSCLACTSCSVRSMCHTHTQNSLVFVTVKTGQGSVLAPATVPSCLHTGSSHTRVAVTSHVARLLTAVCSIRRATSVISLRGRSLSREVCV